MKNQNQNGPNNPNWKGGKFKIKGRLVVLAPKCSKVHHNGYTLEHIVKAEKVLGKPLPTNAVVHHINGIKDDDRNENLIICESNSYHILLHHRASALKACGNANWRRCWICKEYDDIKNLLITHSNNTVRHKVCGVKYTAERRAIVSARLTATQLTET